MFSFINRSVQRILDGQPITIYGDGNQTRCFTHVTDVVCGTVAVYEYGDSDFEVFNIANHARGASFNVHSKIVYVFV
ncbi:MAG: NAD-dependent epimerase/dehydratase family protein [Desulfitobacteriaceae bacterium]